VRIGVTGRRVIKTSCVQGEPGATGRCNISGVVANRGSDNNNTTPCCKRRIRRRATGRSTQTGVVQDNLILGVAVRQVSPVVAQSWREATLLLIRCHRDLCYSTTRRGSHTSIDDGNAIDGPRIRCARLVSGTERDVSGARCHVSRCRGRSASRQSAHRRSASGECISAGVVKIG
jgi:hypothetical protein